jgi:hypothetical protein
MQTSLKPTLVASWLLALLVLILPFKLQAADDIPVRPGLWEVTASGPSISERIKSTTPEKRQSMEQVAGVSIRGDSLVRRVCITPDMIARGVTTRNRPDCDFKQTWKGNVSKITFQCPNGSWGRGELTYPNKESYKGWMESDRTAKNKSSETAQKNPKTPPTKASVRVLQSGKWMAKDCAAKNN